MADNINKRGVTLEMIRAAAMDAEGLVKNGEVALRERIAGEFGLSTKTIGRWRARADYKTVVEMLTPLYAAAEGSASLYADKQKHRWGTVMETIWDKAQDDSSYMKLWLSQMEKTQDADNNEGGDDDDGLDGIALRRRVMDDVIALCSKLLRDSSLDQDVKENFIGGLAECISGGGGGGVLSDSGLNGGTDGQDGE